ncbi:MAG: hypothetical protein IKE55_10825 [Kiritimatiellae bacterium]|nr:hypothetical protein [Kiritimatiellia bacterium]
MSEDSSILDLGSIDFTPEWARKSAGVSVGKFRPSEDADQGRDSGKGPRQFGDRKSFGDRKPFGDRKQFGDRKPFGDRRQSDDRKQFGDRKPFGDRRQFGDRKPFVSRERPLDVDVKLLPETKALGAVIRRIQQDIHAYKLKDLAYFFLDNPSSVLVKITPRAGAESAPSFRQCKACGFAALDEGVLVEHVLAAHLGDYYEAKEVDCEPPKGNFSCVAKCGLSGVLLGPPNIHEFNSVVRDMVRTRYPDMTEEQYRSHIEMVRDQEAIDEWRKGATKRTLFFAKGAAEGAQGLTLEQAEGEFKRTFLASLMDSPKNLMITADVALKSPVRPLQWAVRDALEAERRAPYAMCYALRGAFHHRKLKFFRANDARGPEFVTNIEYREFDSAHAIPELAAAAAFVTAHPCCDKSEFPQEADFEKHLNWLVTTGHAVAFTNGVYSMVEKFPKYGPQWKKRAKKADAKPEGGKPEEAPPAEAKPEEAPPVAEPEPVAEPPVEAAPETPPAEAVPAEAAPAAEAAPETPPAESAPVEAAPAAEAAVEVETKKEESNDETAPVVAE